MLSRIKGSVNRAIAPIVDAIAEVGVKPNHVTFAGFLSGIFSAYLIADGHLKAGAALLAVSGIMDTLDGALARRTGAVTKFGGFLDSVLDRYVDIAVISAFGFLGISWVVVVLALSGALMVSYTRARAEREIERCDVGIAERVERTIIIILGLITGYVWQSLLLVAILSHLTAIQRIVHTYKMSLRRPRSSERGN